jgi:hypothetical protein
LLKVDRHCCRGGQSSLVDPNRTNVRWCVSKGIPRTAEAGNDKLNKQVNARTKFTAKRGKNIDIRAETRKFDLVLVELEPTSKAAMKIAEAARLAAMRFETHHLAFVRSPQISCARTTVKCSQEGA